MMTTRWSLFTSVVERVVVLIFVEEERKEAGTRYEVTNDFSSKLLL